jgi:dolichol-phosphate mannosyltransferase
MNLPNRLPTLETRAAEENRAALETGPGRKLALVIPTLREAANTQVLLERITKSLQPLAISYELIVVDDDSQDGIEPLVASVAQADERVRFLVRKGVRGLAGAVIHGWANSDADVLGVMDADLQHPPELLPQLWHALEGNDVVVASRYAPQGSRKNWSRFRHLVSQISIWMTLPLQRSSIRVQDPMSGFFLLRRNAIRDITLHTQGFKILLEILVRGDIRSVKEIPFTFGHRFKGKSKASIRVGIEYLQLLAKLRKQRRKYES